MVDPDGGRETERREEERRSRGTFLKMNFRALENHGHHGAGSRATNPPGGRTDGVKAGVRVRVRAGRWRESRRRRRRRRREIDGQILKA